MKKLFALSILALALMITGQAQAIQYLGSLSSADSDVLTTGSWVDQGFKIAWDIQLMGDGSWCYDYTLTNVAGNALDPQAISHFTIDVSPYVTENDFWGFDGDWELKADGSGQFPDTPDMMYSLKLDYGEDGQTEWSFYSWRAPTLGDFYAKSAPGTSARNAGFYDDEDPDWNLEDYARYQKILRPDTHTTPIPEPTTLLLLGSGLAIGAGIRRFRRK